MGLDRVAFKVKMRKGTRDEVNASNTFMCICVFSCVPASPKCVHFPVCEYPRLLMCACLCLLWIPTLVHERLLALIVGPSICFQGFILLYIIYIKSCCKPLRSEHVPLLTYVPCSLVLVWFISNTHGKLYCSECRNDSSFVNDSYANELLKKSIINQWSLIVPFS